MMTKHEKEEMRIRAAVRCWVEIEGGEITHATPQFTQLDTIHCSVELKCHGHGWVGKRKFISLQVKDDR